MIKPTTQMLALRMADGTLALMQFLTVGRGDILPTGASWTDEKDGVWQRDATDANVFSEIARSFPAGAVLGYERVAPLDVPADRSYRNAWALVGGKIAHDMPRARELHRAKLREQRAPLLAALDADYLRADEGGNQQEKKRVAGEKQRLRDITADPRIEAATSIDQLKAITT